MTFNVNNIRKCFPIFDTINSVYLDSAATTQKPQVVIDAMSQFYKEEYATVHRGIYELSQKSTKQYDDVREKVRSFLGAQSTKEIIFTRGATEAINLVSQSYSNFLKQGDEILVSEIEHHANFVPWQQLAKSKGVILKTIPVDDNGDFDMSACHSMITERTAFVAIQHVSNVLGTIHPIQEIIRLAHSVGAKVLIDACQSVSHIAVDVQDLDCDFLCFSAHKLYGPTGIGVLYGKEALLEKMPPYQFGGDMIESVSIDDTSFAPLPLKFEAGTPAIAEVIGLGAAIDFVKSIGLDTIASHESDLLSYATQELSKIEGIKIYGSSSKKVGVISFLLGDIHPHDLGTICDTENVSIRAGHHCSQITMNRFNIPATARASFACYNTKDDVDALVRALNRAKEIFT